MYEHYVYAARFGLALAGSQALLALLARGADAAGASRRALAVVSALAVMQTFSAERALTVLQGDRAALGALARDPFQRKMEVLRNVARTLGPQLPGGPARLVFYTPPSSMRLLSAATGREVQGPASAARYALLPAVLDEGRGLRALFPDLTEVRFAETPAPGDTGVLVATHSQSGEVLVTGTGPTAYARLAALWAMNGFAVDARRCLEDARTLYPGSALLAETAARAAPPESLEIRLREVRARFPDSLAAPPSH